MGSEGGDARRGKAGQPGVVDPTLVEREGADGQSRGGAEAVGSAKPLRTATPSSGHDGESPAKIVVWLRVLTD